MFVIVEKMISLASFDVRLAHAGTSVVFSYLIFSNFKDLITLKSTGVLKNCAPSLHAKFIYFSINPSKITFSFLQKFILNS